MQAALLFLLLLAAYWANGDILPGNDPIASVRLAGKLVSKHRLVFTPEEDPFMFNWHLRTPQGERHVHFHSWRSSVNGEPVRPAYERGDLSEPEANYYLMKTRYPNVYANRYGVGAALFAVPFVAAVYPFARDLYDRPSADILWFTSKLAASCAVAASAVLLFLAALPWLRPKNRRLAGTGVWSGHLRVEFEQPGTVAARPDGVLSRPGNVFPAAKGPSARGLLGGAELRPGLCLPAYRRGGGGGCGHLLLGLRPTGAASLRGRRPARGPAAGGIQPARVRHAHRVGAGECWRRDSAGTGGVHAAAGGGCGPHGSTATATQMLSHIAAARAGGILISPSRGLLVFSPVVVFAFWGLVRAFRDSRFAALRAVGLAALALFLVVARWYGWAGGWAYGPRLLADAGTLLAFLAIPVAEEIRRSRARAAAFGVCLAWAVAVQVVGAFAYDVIGWNEPYLLRGQAARRGEALFSPPQRRPGARPGRGAAQIEQRKDQRHGQEGPIASWSLRDNQILYYVEHFSAARRLKRIAIEKFLKDSA